MTCVHLQRLFQLCEENHLRFSSADLVHVVCDQCQRDEVCPSMLMDQFETKHPDADEIASTSSDSATSESASSKHE